MGWTALPISPLSSCQGEGIQLLNDGRILAYGLISSLSSFSCLFTPDINGSYANGSWGLLKDMGYEHHGGLLHLAKNGYVYCFGSHPFAGTDSGQYVINRWNPNTDTWSLVANGLSVSHQGRTGMFILDDLRVCYTRANNTVVIFDSGTETLSEISASGFGFSESAMTILPDGRALGYTNIDNYIFEFKPEYDGSRVSAGSISGGGNTPSVTTAVITNTETWPYNTGVTWRDKVGFSSVVSEIGPNMYYYKVGAVVMPGAWAGELFELNPVTKNVSSRAKTPLGDITNDPAWFHSKVGSIASSHAGQNAAQIVAGGSLSILCDSFLAVRPTFVVLPTTNGRWVCIAGTTTSWPVSGYIDGVSSPETITFTSLSITPTGSNVMGQYMFGSGDTTSVIPTAARAYQDALQYATGEGSCCILPSGKLAYGAGQRNIGGIASAGHVFLWDGTTTSPVKIPLPNNSTISPWLTHMTVTPNGDLFLEDWGTFYLYTETGISPDPAQKPIVDNIPLVLAQGATYQVVGRQLTGLHVGAQYGDETPNQCNHTLVRIRTDNGPVYYCPTTNWSYRGIQPNRAGSVSFKVPTNVPLGAHTLNVISNGVASDDIYIEVKQFNVGDAIFIDTY